MTQSSDKVATDTVEINKGEYYGLKFQRPSDGYFEISIQVLDGPKVDVYLTDERGYQNYADGMQFREYNESPTTSVKDITIQKPSSEKVYSLIIENNGGSGLLSALSSKESVVEVNIVYVE